MGISATLTRSRLNRGKQKLRALGSARVPLPLAHARDRDAREHAVLRERIAIRKLLGFRAAVHVHDEKASDRRRAVVGLSGAREHQDVFLAAEIVAMRLQMFVPDSGRVRVVGAGYDPQHASFSLVECSLLWSRNTCSESASGEAVFSLKKPSCAAVRVLKMSRSDRPQASRQLAAIRLV